MIRRTAICTDSGLLLIARPVIVVCHLTWGRALTLTPWACAGRHVMSSEAPWHGQWVTVLSQTPHPTAPAAPYHHAGPAAGWLTQCWNCRPPFCLFTRPRSAGWEKRVSPELVTVRQLNNHSVNIGRMNRWTNNLEMRDIHCLLEGELGNQYTINKNRVMIMRVNI